MSKDANGYVSRQGKPERLAKLIRLLASDKAGERLAALDAIDRTLRAAGRDWNWLAALVEEHAARPPEPVVTGPQQEPAATKRRARRPAYRGPPQWRNKALWCSSCAEYLSELERGFISTLLNETRRQRNGKYPDLDPARRAKLDAIFANLQQREAGGAAWGTYHAAS